MSEETNKKNALAGIIETFKTNPKALYAAVGGLAVIVIAAMMGGSDDGVISAQSTASVSVGQTVTVRNPNIGDTWLTTVPRMGAEDTGEEKEQFICLVKAGATATVDEETVVTYIKYVRLTVKDGDCAGKTGWSPKVNVSAK